MQIEETKESTRVVKEELPPSERKDDAKVREGFEFNPVPLADPKVFPNFKSQETQQRFFKWGDSDAIEVAKFRFNRAFHLVPKIEYKLGHADDFLKDLFNSRNVIASFPPLCGMGVGECTGVKYTKMNCNVLNMSFFDVFHENGICGEDGSIRMDYEERHEGIVLGDKLRKVMLWEDYDDMDAYDLIHSDKYQKEFIFKLFQHIAIGGGVCQYENNITEYLETTKVLYKDLVCVAKDPDTQEIKSFSHCFRIDSITGYENRLYTTKHDDHPQNCFYVLVDPVNWHVNFFYHKWLNFW